MRTIVSRTYLIDDPDAMAAVDAALAERVVRWGALSVKKTEDAIDALVDEHDPGALRRTTESASQETVQFGSPTDVAGTTTIWARLNSADAALIEQSVEALARSVCDADPRSASTNAAPKPSSLRSPTPRSAARADSPTAPAAPPVSARPTTPSSTPWPTRQSIAAATATQESDAADAVPAPEPPRASAKPAYVFGAGNHADRTVGRHPGAGHASARSATPARTLHPSRATRRRRRCASSCAAAI